MGIEDSKTDRLESGFMNKITNFREHGVSFNKFHTKLVSVKNVSSQSEVSVKNVTFSSKDLNTSILVTLGEILLALSQCRRLFKFLFTDLFISFMDCFTLKKQVSSAK